jgi:prepilin-type N-terminal cleavage/methylation domain-containing protein
MNDEGSSTMNYSNHERGVTLVELMVVVALIAVITAIAIPAYQDYVNEALRAMAAHNLENLRLAVEDYGLDQDGDFSALDGDEWDPGGTQTLDTAELGWHPDGDEDRLIYQVAVTASTVTIRVLDVDNSQELARSDKSL